MAKKLTAGILLYRVRRGELEVFLVHPGGPFWAKKDDGAWSIPKGECAEDEDPLACALREFKEETGIDLTEEGGHSFASSLPCSSLRRGIIRLQNRVLTLCCVRNATCT